MYYPDTENDAITIDPDVFKTTAFEHRLAEVAGYPDSVDGNHFGEIYLDQFPLSRADFADGYVVDTYLEWFDMQLSGRYEAVKAFIELGEITASDRQRLDRRNRIVTPSRLAFNSLHKFHAVEAFDLLDMSYLVIACFTRGMSYIGMSNAIPRAELRNAHIGELLRSVGGYHYVSIENCDDDGLPQCATDIRRNYYPMADGNIDRVIVDETGRFISFSREGLEITHIPRFQETGGYDAKL